MLRNSEATQARLVASIGLGMGITFGVLNTIFLFLNRNWIGRIFTDQEEVLELVQHVVSLSSVWSFAAQHLAV